MNDRDSTRRGDAGSDDRISRLSEAILRINARLDPATVLEEAIEAACALTGGAYGVIATLDERGAVKEIVTDGFSPEERRKMLEWPDGPRLFAHLRDLSEPLREADLPGYLRSLGLSQNPWGSRRLLGTPMRHRGQHLGSLFLGDGEGGGEFTPEDEKILTLFASQAATAIANARTHREVERARADLEALIETSPVGVVVFDAGTGRAVSVNREARRIVDGLRTPGHPAEQLLGVLTARLTDGQEISLRELPLARQFDGAPALRAEEIELSVRDGRSVRTLINATPIRSGKEEAVSVVVTMQDLAPIEELERQRAEFLAMVSHELRAPLTSIKGSTATVLGTLPVPPSAELLQFFRIIDGQADLMRGLISNLLDAGSIEAGTLTVAPEPTSIMTLVDRARTAFLSGGGQHAIIVDLPPDLPWVMADPERIVQVLSNLFSNAAQARRSVAPDPGRGSARRRVRLDLGRGPGPGDPARPASQPLPEADQARGRHGARSHDLQGSRGSARRSHPRRERRHGPRGALHLHSPDRPGDTRGSPVR